MFAAVIASQTQAGILVLEVSGDVQTENRLPVTLLMSVTDGTQLHLAAKAKLTGVDLVTGKEYVLDGGHKYKVSNGSVSSGDGQQITGKALPVRNLSQVKLVTSMATQASIVMRSLKTSGSMQMFPHGSAVAKTTPLLRWDEHEGASHYKVTIIKEDDSPQWVATTSSLALQIPPNKALQPGQAYTWKLEAFSPVGLLADQCNRFHVLDAEALDQLQKLEPEPHAPKSRRVLYAVMLSQSGATQEAAEIWQALAREGADDTTLKNLADQHVTVDASAAATRYPRSNRTSGLAECSTIR